LIVVKSCSRGALPIRLFGLLLQNVSFSVNTLRHRPADRQTDRQTDDIMATIADHTAWKYDQINVFEDCKPGPCPFVDGQKYTN